MRTTYVLAAMAAIICASSPALAGRSEERLAESAIYLRDAPCGKVVEAARANDTTVVARCSNGLIYGVVKVPGGYVLGKRNGLTGSWEPY